MSESPLQHGRISQKRRTRAAILSAAAALLDSGTLPSVAEAADAADVSRATAYRYFPTQEHLLSEITLDSAAHTVDQALEQLAPAEAPPARLDTVVQAIYQLVAGNDLAFRALLRLSMQHANAPESASEDALRRGGRRMGWLEAALEPLRQQLDDAAFRRLISALALCTGIETQIVLRDICALDQAEAEQVTRWAAQALLRASLEERG